MQHGGVIAGYVGVAGHANKFFPGDHAGYINRLIVAQNFSDFTTACMAVERNIFEDLGGFDELNLAVVFNDIDFG